MSQPPMVFVGVATHDTIAQVARFPEPDERMVVDDLVTAGGGPAATAAVAAARQGAEVAFVGAVGDDDVGDTILAELAAEGVDVDHCARLPDTASAASLVIVDTGASTRAILNRPPPPLDVEQLPDTTRRFVAAADWVHVDQAGWSAIASWWRASSERPHLSIDAGNDLPDFDAAGIDLYVPTIAALRRRHGGDDDLSAEQAVAAGLADGALTVVATDGAHGAYVGRPGRPTVNVPAIDGPVRSTLGAGDVFHGALLAAVARGEELTDAVRDATRVAYASCQAIDGRSGIPRRTATSRPNHPTANGTSP